MSERAPEERVLYALLALVGAVPMAAGITAGGPFGAGFTVCLLMAAAGTIGYVSDVWRGRERALPEARTVVRSSTTQTR